MLADSGTVAAKKKQPAYTQDQVAASLAANPQAAGANGTPFAGGQTWGGVPADPSQTAASGGDQNPFLSNPGYLAALAAEQSGSQQADAALRAAQEAAIVGYGDPSIAAALGLGSVSDNTSAAARANYLAGNSSLARLDKQRDTNQQGNVNNLAAHGILFSGELGYQQGQIGKNYGNAVYDTQQQLLSGLTAAQQQNLATKAGLHSQTIGALTGAYDTMVANPQFYGAAQPSSASTPSVAAAPSGSNATVAGSLGLPQSQTFGGTAGPYIGTLPAAKSRLAAKPLPNPYSTGQKRFG